MEGVGIILFIYSGLGKHGNGGLFDGFQTECLKICQASFLFCEGNFVFPKSLETCFDCLADNDFCQLSASFLRLSVASGSLQRRLEAFSGFIKQLLGSLSFRLSSRSMMPVYSLKLLHLIFNFITSVSISLEN